MESFFKPIVLDILLLISVIAIIICGVISCIENCCPICWCVDKEEEKGPSPSPLLTVEDNTKDEQYTRTQ